MSLVYDLLCRYATSKMRKIALIFPFYLTVTLIHFYCCQISRYKLQKHAQINQAWTKSEFWNKFTELHNILLKFIVIGIITKDKILWRIKLQK